MKIDELFRTPTAAFRGKPFWAWNGRLEAEEIRRQVRIFRRMGMGGAFLHARVGLETPFLSDEWFGAIRAGAEECHAQGLEAWLYDEDRWPSGYAGGFTTKDPENRMRFLVMDVASTADDVPEGELLGIWEGNVSKGDVSSLRPREANAKPAPGNQFLLFRVEAMRGTSWFNGQTYLDTLSESAVEAFIRDSYAPYVREIPNTTRSSVRGVFTDEPCYCLFRGTHMLKGRKGIPFSFLPWTPRLPEEFQRTYGYDLLEHLPELFLNEVGKPWPKVRLDYRNCITDLFVRNFGRQIYDWCDAHGFQLTGHLFEEQDLVGLTMAVGSPMRFYEHMHVPGIDMLSQYRREFDTAKQCQSAIAQTGRTWFLSEMYGCTGWDLTFEGHKAVGDWQAALGVNVRCHHLSWYTMEGEAKRDFPASIHFQSPWWKHYRVVEDYFSRLHVALTQGTLVQKILVIHPIESMFLRMRTEIVEDPEPWTSVVPKHKEVRELKELLPKLSHGLLSAQLDFAYGDEEMMGRMASVAQQDGKPLLQFGSAAYEAVLVPPSDTLRATTLQLLADFARAGGTVLFCGAPPAYVDGSPSARGAEVARGSVELPFALPAITSALEPFRTVALSDTSGAPLPGLLYQMRQDQDRHILFLCNMNREDDAVVQVRVHAMGNVIEYDPMSGERSRLPSRQSDGWTTFTTELPASGSRLFVLDPARERKVPLQKRWATRRRQKLARVEAAPLGEPNALVLDCARFRLGSDQKWQSRSEVLKIDRRIRERMGLEFRGGDMVQPWARQLPENAPTLPVVLEFCFEVKALPSGPVALAIEKPHRFQIFVNDQRLSADDARGWWVDPCLHTIPLESSMLEPGTNRVRLEIDYNATDGLESIFLLGDFGVEVTGQEVVLSGPLQPLDLGDWRSAGLPFYGGSVAYTFRSKVARKRGERVVLRCPDFTGTVARVLVDGKEAGFLPWPPYETDITRFLPPVGTKDTRLAVTVEVFGSRRNTFGPLHQADAKPFFNAPQHWLLEGKDWSDAYVLKPYGLLAPPELLFQEAKK